MLTAQALSTMTPEQIKALPPEVLAALSDAQLEALLPEQLVGLSAQHLAALSPGQLLSVTGGLAGTEYPPRVEWLLSLGLPTSFNSLKSASRNSF